MKLRTKILMILMFTFFSFSFALVKASPVKATDLPNEGYGWARMEDTGANAQSSVIWSFYNAGTGAAIQPDYVSITHTEWTTGFVPPPPFHSNVTYLCSTAPCPSSVTINLDPNTIGAYCWTRYSTIQKAGYHTTVDPSLECTNLTGRSNTMKVYLAPDGTNGTTAFSKPYQHHLNFPVAGTWYSFDPTYTVLGYPSQNVTGAPAGGTTATANFFQNNIGPQSGPFPSTFTIPAQGFSDGWHNVSGAIKDNSTGFTKSSNSNGIDFGKDTKKPIVGKAGLPPPPARNNPKTADTCVITNPAVGGDPPSVPYLQPVTLNFNAYDDTSSTSDVSGLKSAQAQVSSDNGATWNSVPGGSYNGTLVISPPGLLSVNAIGWNIMGNYTIGYPVGSYKIRVRVNDLAKNSTGQFGQYSDPVECGSVNIVNQDFSLAISPLSQSVARESTSSAYTVTAASINNFAGDVTLAGNDLSANGITFSSFTPGAGCQTSPPVSNAIHVSSGLTCTATFTVHTSSTTPFSNPPAPYNLTVTGTSVALLFTHTAPATLTVIISPPTALNITFPPCTPGNALPSSSIIFNWTASSGATKYEVRVSDDQNFGAYAIKTDITAVTTDGAKTDGNNWNGPLSLVSGNKLSLTPRTPYYWRVIANDSPGTHTSAPAGYINAGTVPPNSFSVTGFCQYSLSISQVQQPDPYAGRTLGIWITPASPALPYCDFSGTDYSAYVYKGGDVLCTVAQIKNSENSSAAAPSTIKIGVWQEGGETTQSYKCSGTTIPGTSQYPYFDSQPPISPSNLYNGGATPNPFTLDYGKDIEVVPQTPISNLPPGHTATVNIVFRVNTLKGNYTGRVIVDYNCANRTEAVYRFSRGTALDANCAHNPDDTPYTPGSCIGDSFADNSMPITYFVGGAGWFNTTGGDVGAGTDTYAADLTVSTPLVQTKSISDYLVSSSTVGIKSTSGATSRAWQIKGTDIPAKPLPAFVSRGGIYNYFNQKFRATAAATWQNCNPTFKFDDTSLSTSKYWHCVGSPYILNPTQVGTISGSAVIFVDGDLNIATNGSTSANSNKVFLVSGNVNVGSAVTSLEGVYIVGGTFHSGSFNTCLTVNGAVYANTISMERTATTDAGSTCGAAGSDAAAETFAYDPKYMVNMNTLLGISSTSWQEIAP